MNDQATGTEYSLTSYANKDQDLNQSHCYGLYLISMLSIVGCCGAGVLSGDGLCQKASESRDHWTDVDLRLDDTESFEKTYHGEGTGGDYIAKDLSNILIRRRRASITPSSLGRCTYRPLRAYLLQYFK
jgi:hypothetical protein